MFKLNFRTLSAAALQRGKRIASDYAGPFAHNLRYAIFRTNCLCGRTPTFLRHNGKKIQCKFAQLKAKYPFYDAGWQRFARAEEGVGLLRPLLGPGAQHGGSRRGQRDSTYDVNFKVTLATFL